MKCWRGNVSSSLSWSDSFIASLLNVIYSYPPFNDESQFRLYEKILTSEPQFPSHFHPNVRDLLKHLLTTDLTRRYGNLARGYRDVMDHPCKWKKKGGEEWDAYAIFKRVQRHQL